jgi:ribosomal protein S4
LVNRSRPKARLSRALGIPLTPKWVRYFERRPFPPGVHGRRPQRPAYLSVDLSGLRVTFLRPPARHEVPVVCDTQLVVEFYSR